MQMYTREVLRCDMTHFIGTSMAGYRGKTDPGTWWFRDVSEWDLLLVWRK